MDRDQLNDLAAFAVVAEEGSFTRAAARLAMSQPALSRAMKGLEARLNVRLLSRTTRSVSTTQAGETLLALLRPALDDIMLGLTKVSAMGETPSGTVRLTATKNAITSIILPKLPGFLLAHPHIRIEMTADDDLTDIVSGRFDAGIRFGDIVERDMIAVRVGPDTRRAIVASPEYFSSFAPPLTPYELSVHRCITYRLHNTGGIYAWPFQRDGRAFEVRVEGAVVFNDADLMREAAVAGLGIAYVYEDDAMEDIRAGRLVRILDEWGPTFPGYYLYHPSRRQTPPALTALIAALKYSAAKP